MRRKAAVAILVLAALTMAVSWSGVFLPLADNINIGAAIWWPLLVIGTAAACWFLRDLRALGVGIAVMLAALATGLLIFRPLLKSAPPMEHRTQTIRIIEFNMLKSNPQSARDAEWLAAQDADILVLLEASRMQKHWGKALQDKYPTMVSCSVHYPCSTVLFSRYPLLASQSLAGDGDADNRKALSALTATLDVNGRAFTVLAAHLDRPWPMGEQKDWVVPMRKAAAGVNGPSVMTGDFNSAPWTHAVRSIGDSGNFRLATGFATSWPARNSAMLRLPLDQLYLRGRVRAVDVRTGPKRGSDHLPLMITLEIPGGSGDGA
ncbi:endonuclease/exonuclease/phosphatase family protein [Croceicoccus sp. Ery15]|uniref:endonuclease/exonuclease/phosphatase family protein n=1 Tax=Croceicoccus sp. Ery15 TaxID=1703338 RepID=UPI001E28B1D0|nr:endonuclease/exonuclease/phosphatase family protein [Croceicoccus sp. Ery15]